MNSDTEAITTAGWSIDDGRLTRSFVFRDFSQAWAFLTQVALAAECVAHHPRITNEWNRVTLSLVTHDAGNTVTANDHALAAIINGLIASQPDL